MTVMKDIRLVVLCWYLGYILTVGALTAVYGLIRS